MKLQSKHTQKTNNTYEHYCVLILFTTHNFSSRSSRFSFLTANSQIKDICSMDEGHSCFSAKFNITSYNLQHVLAIPYHINLHLMI